MALAIDASSPARVLVSNGPCVTASFTPPAGALLLALVSADGTGNTGANACFFTCSCSAPIGFVPIAEQSNRTGSSSGGGCAVYAALTTAAVAMTVTADSEQGATARDTTLKVWVVTGIDIAAAIAAVAQGTSTANPLSVGLTTTVANSRLFAVYADWSAQGIPTSATDTVEGATLSGQFSGASGYKNADTASAGTAVTVTFDPPGTTATTINWIAVEIRPAPGSARTRVKLGAGPSQRRLGLYRRHK